MILKELKKGDWFTKKEIENPNSEQVWIKGDYIRPLKKFEIIRFSDINDTQLMAGNKEVYINFIF